MAKAKGAVSQGLQHSSPTTAKERWRQVQVVFAPKKLGDSRRLAVETTPNGLSNPKEPTALGSAQHWGIRTRTYPKVDSGEAAQSPQIQWSAQRQNGSVAYADRAESPQPPSLCITEDVLIGFHLSS
jgi:hypothetical protein